MLNETTLTALPSDSAALQKLVGSLWLELEREQQRADEQSRRAEEQSRRAEEQSQRADHLHLENLQLQQEVDRYKKLLYGPRADRLRSPRALLQMLLEFAQDLDQQPLPAEEAAAGPDPPEEMRRVKRRPGRRALEQFENLPVTTQVYELTPAERACPGCGVERQEIGEEESWQVEHIPAHFERLRHVRKKYACSHCEQQGENPRIQRAAKEEAVVDKGLAGPGLLAYIVTSKYADYLPLYRLEGIFERQGLEISRGTQSVWCGDVANLVEPLYQHMAEQVRQSHVVATDDTVMPMLSPGQTKQARMWVYVGDEAHPYNVFDFTLTRGRDGPTRFLGDYNQVLLADAYGGYNGVVAGNQMIRAGCWAHARRKFVEAEKAGPEMARAAVEGIGALYAVERQAQAEKRSAAERLQLRGQKSVPLLAQLRARLLEWKERLLPKHPLAQAVNYTLGQWQELNVFCTDGAVPIDNNVSEREMKRVVLNRKNSLFVGHERGGRTAAILTSLTSSCRRHAVDPQRYLTQLLVNLPQVKMSELSAWLPDQWKTRQAARLASLPPPTSPPSPNLRFT